MAVYLLHLASPLPNSRNNANRHYLGYADNVSVRVKHHQNGTGARFTQRAVECGISMEVVRIWQDGDRTFERKLKNAKNGPRLCPQCNGKGTVE